MNTITGATSVSEAPACEAPSLVKSRQRVADHGEVFTPAWLVDDMLNLVRSESERIDARFLEPACGSGNFLVPVLRRKLATVRLRYGKSSFENCHYALFALMCVYGIELLPDNIRECRNNLLCTFTEYLGAAAEDVWRRGAVAVLEANIVQANAVTMTTVDGEPLTFPEWAYLGKGKYKRRDFSYESLTQRSAIKGSLFEALDESDLFKPTCTYLPMTVNEVSR